MCCGRVKQFVSSSLHPTVIDLLYQPSLLIVVEGLFISKLKILLLQLSSVHYCLNKSIESQLTMLMSEPVSIIPATGIQLWNFEHYPQSSPLLVPHPILWNVVEFHGNNISTTFWNWLFSDKLASILEWLLPRITFFFGKLPFPSFLCFTVPGQMIWTITNITLQLLLIYLLSSAFSTNFWLEFFCGCLPEYLSFFSPHFLWLGKAHCCFLLPTQQALYLTSI